MEFNTVMAFVAVAALLVISPGPNGFLIARTVPVAGQRAGMANITGFVAAFYVHGTLSIFGLSLILVQSAHAFLVLKLVGAAYLIWIGVKALWAAFRRNEPAAAVTPTEKGKAVSLRVAFVEGFLTNMLNPKVSLFYLAAFPQFIDVSDHATSAYILVSAHALVNLIWFSALVLMLSRVKRVTSSARFKQWLNAMTGAVFIGFGAKLALMKNA